MLGILLLVAGIVLLVGGIGLLVAASIAAAGAAAFNHICSMNPMCVPAPDLGGGLTVGGVLALAIGIGLATYGIIRIQNRST